MWDIYRIKIYRTIVIKNGKIVWKHRSYCWFLCLSMNFCGGCTGTTLREWKMTAFRENFISGDDFKVFLAIIVVVTMVQMLLRQLRRSLLMNCIAPAYLNNSNKGWLQRHLRLSSRNCRRHFKICTKNGAVTSPWLVLSTREVR